MGRLRLAPGWVSQIGSQEGNHRLVPRGGTLDWLLDVDEVPHIGYKMEEPQIGSLDWDPIWEQIRGTPSINQSREPPSGMSLSGSKSRDLIWKQIRGASSRS